jgi:cytochrome c oxidase assembly protein subunit 15
MNQNQKMMAFASLLIFLVFDLMLLGAAVRSQDAGLACPDWPLCFGQLIPDLHLKVYLEFIHRVVAGAVFLAYSIFLYFLFHKFAQDNTLKFFGLLGLLILFAQVIMGGLTVLKLLAAGIVTTHLLLATSFLALLYIIRERIKEHETGQWTKPSKYRWILFVPLIVVLGQLILGGTVASTYAGKICLDFPKCLGEWVPTLKGQIGLQVMHRFGAYTVFLVSLGFFVASRWSRWGKQSLSPRIRRSFGMFLGLVVIQIAVGVTGLKLLVPTWITVVHLAMALLLVRTTLEIAYWAVRGEST